MVTAAVVVLGLLITVTIPLTFPPDGGPTALDRAIGDRVHTELDNHPGLYHALVVPSNAYVVLPILLIGVLCCLYRRDWWGAGFLIVVPELVVALNTWVLKPLWGRHLDDYLAYPSGHTVQFTAIVTGVLLIVANTRVRIAIAVIAACALVAFSVGMIGLGYHHPSDIAGGAAVALAAVVGCWAVSAVLRRRVETRPDSGGSIATTGGGVDPAGGESRATEGGVTGAGMRRGVPRRTQPGP